MPTLLTHGVKALSLAALLGAAATAPAAAQTIYGLQLALPSTYSLVTFQASVPGTFTATAPITGLGSGQVLVGLDTRPNTGELFALGYNSAAATGTANAQVYRLATTGALTAVGSPISLALGNDLLPRIGFDFNPTVDRIRVTAANGANYRLNPVTGGIAAIDGTLAYASTDTNAGQTPSVGASAYTNSYIGSTATTLYNVDETASRLVSQNPPNNGTLNTVGALGVSVSTLGQSTDLDIAYAGGQNVAYMSVLTANLATTTATSTLYTVNLSTGAATAVGTLGSSNAPSGIADIAVAIDRTVPATVTGQLAYALAGTNLVTFDTAVPGTVRTSVGITGVDAAYTLAGLDVRPATNTLYALGYNAAATGTTANAQLYTLNGATGVAVAVGAAVRLELGMGSIGFDFNPTVDRIRVVSATRANYRLNPTDGTISATDGTLAFASGTGTPSIGAAAYTNSFMGASATSGTTLYDYDEGLNNLYTQAPPNDGVLNLVGSSGLTVNGGTPNVDLDIYSTGAGVNTAYMVANTGTSANTSLYTVNLATGAATLVGAIGSGIAARDIAIAGASGVVTAARPAELATDFSLFPNPLAGTTSLSFGLPRAARVELLVTDALGRQVDALDAGLLPAGPQTVRWQRGSQAAGLYFFRLRFDGLPAGTRQAALTQ